MAGHYSILTDDQTTPGAKWGQNLNAAEKRVRSWKRGANPKESGERNQINFGKIKKQVESAREGRQVGFLGTNRASP